MSDWKEIDSPPDDLTVVLLTDGTYRAIGYSFYACGPEGYYRAWRVLGLKERLAGLPGLIDVSATGDDKFAPRHWAPFPSLSLPP